MRKINFEIGYRRILILSAIICISCQSSEKSPSSEEDFSTGDVEPSVGSKTVISNGKNEQVGVGPESRVNWKRVFRQRVVAGQTETAVKAKIDLDIPMNVTLESISELINNRRIEEARTKVSVYLKDNASDPHAWVQLVKINLIQSDVSAAYRNLETLKRVLSSRGDQNQTEELARKFLLAKTYSADSQHQKARELLIEILKLDHTFIPGYILMAETLIREQQYAEARYALIQGLDRAGDDSDLFAFMGFVELALGDVKKARDWYTRAEQKEPRNTYARCLNVILLLDEGKSEAAEQLARTVVMEDPTSDQAHLLLARAQISLGKSADARGTLEALLKTNSKNVHARFLMGVSFEQEDSQKAKSYFSESLMYLEKRDPMYRYAEVSIERLSRAIEKQ